VNALGFVTVFAVAGAFSIPYIMTDPQVRRGPNDVAVIRRLSPPPKPVLMGEALDPAPTYQLQINFGSFLERKKKGWVFHFSFFFIFFSLGS
jgi:hypothetical protein